MKKYKHIFFDLDHTLWDFERCSKETVIELYDRYELKKIGLPNALDFYHAFSRVNFEMWGLYNQNKIDKEYIRDKRFGMVFEQMGLSPHLSPPQIGAEYLLECPQKPYLIPDTIEVLEYLKERYQLHILTNGFLDSSNEKLKSADITHYFKEVVTSECSGHKKPDKRIFEHALERAQASVEDSLMIGDNYNTDIKGAVKVGMSSIFFNPGQIKRRLAGVLQIKALNELKKHL